ncbi:hypothetical protein SPIRO4BDMA_40571 [uncultured spirochete]|uniref:Uncharacterized protein n=1 Tax=uncultured spirochete TaxID=156406 RepID=A0A3P3XPN8_9SPIR|nr:hypothetical protein SPIRO4BDMA_40571 [uncultured spirochete]
MQLPPKNRKASIFSVESQKGNVPNMNKQKISIHEVARLAGVSKSTVSRVISDKGGSVSHETLEKAQMARFDGVILNSVTDNIDLIKNLGVPAVLIGERSAAQNIDTVGTDTLQATRIGMEYLYETGHRKIALATSDHGSERYLSLHARAYRDFLQEKGLPFNPELLFSVNLDAEGGRELAKQLLGLQNWAERMDSLFCGNDIVAITAMNELRKYGIIAGIDLSIIGMDDIPASSQTYPPLTTVRKPRERIAVNPKREGLLWKAKKADLPCMEIAQLMREVRAITGVPAAPRFTDRPVALIEWRDGSIIDTVRQLEAE